MLGLNTVLKHPAPGLTGFMVGRHTDQDFYKWMESNPVPRDAFHRYMEDKLRDLPSWLDVLRFDEELGKGLTGSDVAFVDVGGGQGQQCQALKDRFPSLPGRVILQDRPEVLEKALAVEGMERHPYDYVTEQPVKSSCRCPTLFAASAEPSC
jgi:hypothetical protein